MVSHTLPVPVTQASGEAQAAATLTEVSLLGPFQVRIDHQHIPTVLWRTARGKALFAYLAYRAGSPVSRDTLIGVLWPGEAPDVCLNSLHKTVYMLRQTLGMMGGKEGKELLTFAAGHYTVAAAGLRVDALCFKRAVFEAGWCARLHDREGVRQHYQKAIQLYRGDFLEEDYRSEWVVAERERLRSAYGTALRSLAVLYEEDGDRDRGAGYWQQLLRTEPCAEDGYHALIGLAVAQGQRGTALRLAQQCTQTLRRELGVTPSGKLAALIARL